VPRENLVWIDIETTGLDINKDVILEIAAVVTDSDLNVLWHLPTYVIHQPDEVLDGMAQWCVEQHGKTGLTDACRASVTTLQEADLRIVEHLKRYCDPGRSPMCGNTISFDRKFISKHMPELECFLHYRNIDTTAVKLLARYWYPDLPEFPKSKNHRAKVDIMESIGELQYLRGSIFKSRAIVQELSAASKWINERIRTAAARVVGAEMHVNDLARKAAAQVEKTGQPYHFKPMSPEERRNIHAIVAKNSEVISVSEGDGPNRHVVIYRIS